MNIVKVLIQSYDSYVGKEILVCKTRLAELWPSENWDLFVHVQKDSTSCLTADIALFPTTLRKKQNTQKN